MIVVKHTLIDPAGLHARVATAVALAAQRHESSVGISYQGFQVAASDPMGLMRLDACNGDVLLITGDGPDEQNAVDAVVAALEGEALEGEV